MACAPAFDATSGGGRTANREPGVLQTSDSLPKDPLSLLAWRSIGPPRGGRSIAVSGVKGRPKEAYFGAVGGGLWKTVDGGENWAPVTDGQIKSSSVGAVAVSESNPDIVFIGMGESCIRGNIMPGDGVYKSTDAGKTWTHIGFADIAGDLEDPHPSHQSRHRLRRRRSASTACRATSAASSRAPTAARPGSGRCFATHKTGAVDLAIDRRNPNVIYAALWEAYRVEYQMSSGGPGSGLFKSTDGGETWTEITRNPGLPAGVVGRIGVAVSGADSNRVYALVENENGGLFASDDAGTDVDAGQRATATSASARSTTRTSPPIRTTRTPSTC